MSIFNIFPFFGLGKLNHCLPFGKHYQKLLNELVYLKSRVNVVLTVLTNVITVIKTGHFVMCE